MSKNLSYYFLWGNRVGRDIEKFILLFMGKAHWTGSRLDYNDDVKSQLKIIDSVW